MIYTDSDTTITTMPHARANGETVGPSRLLSKGRLEFDAGWTDLAQSFMAIRKTMTASGRKVTYEASRSEETGHADLAWACLHALDNEPLEGVTANNTSIMEFS